MQSRECGSRSKWCGDCTYGFQHLVPNLLIGIGDGGGVLDVPQFSSRSRKIGINCCAISRWAKNPMRKFTSLLTETISAKQNAVRQTMVYNRIRSAPSGWGSRGGFFEARICRHEGGSVSCLHVTVKKWMDVVLSEVNSHQKTSTLVVQQMETVAEGCCHGDETSIRFSSCNITELGSS